MYSMTGYGKANVVCEGRELTIELKAVNHRFLDLNIKMPKIFSCCEDILRKTIAQNVSRGHIDVYVNYSDKSEKEKHVDIDFGLAAGYVEAARQLAEKYEGIQNDFTLNSLMRIPDVLKAVAPEEDEEFLKSLVSKTVSIACDDLNEMRRFEGEKIKDDLLSRIDNVENFVVQIKEKAPDVAEEYSEKLKIRISEALADVDYDESKFLNEVAFFIDKSNIDEEIARLFSHVSHFRQLIGEDDCAGRKLDFLVQELNREANTICSKSNNAQLTSIALSLKNEIEKIREQVQNAE